MRSLTYAPAVALTSLSLCRARRSCTREAKNALLTCALLVYCRLKPCGLHCRYDPGRLHQASVCQVHCLLVSRAPTQTTRVGWGETISAQRRLDPTPWLNVNFREPLYLKDVPVQHDDTRNELEQKFPEFFYNKLSGEVRGTRTMCRLVTKDSKACTLVENSRVYLSLAWQAGGDDGANDINPPSTMAGAQGYDVQRTPMSVLNPQHPDFLHKDNPEYQSKLAQRGPPRR